MGKGIIVPYQHLVNMNLEELRSYDELEDLTLDNYEEHDFKEFLEEIIQDKHSIEFEISFLGHDALEFRHGFCETIIFDGERKSVLEYLKRYKDTTLVFVGKYRSIPCDGEFSCHVEAPEVVYSMAALLPGIMEIYPELLAADCDKLKKICNQEPHIWTFTNDCTCCT